MEERHDVRIDYPLGSEMPRLVCHTCESKPHLLRQKYLNDEQWDEAKTEFLAVHPNPAIQDNHYDE